MSDDYGYLLTNDEIAAYERRIADLLEANTKLVSERNIAQGRATHFQMAVDFLLMHQGMAQLRRLEAENKELKEKIGDAQHELQMMRAEAAILMDRLVLSEKLIEAARALFEQK